MTKLSKLIILPMVLGLVAMGGIDVASAQTSPRLGIQLATSGLTTPLDEGDTDAVLARLMLDNSLSSEAVRVASLPFRLVLGGGALANTLEDCAVVNESNTGVDLNTGSRVASNMSAGLNTVVLDQTLVVPAGSSVTVALRCDIGNNLVTGGTYTFSMNTTEVAATGVSTGLPAVVYVRGQATPPIVLPPVIVTPPATPAPNTPGLPATGSGGEMAANLAILLGATLVGTLGLAVLQKKAA